ncbi:MAG: ABC transporter permease subunit [Lachnospiraceae bacterium]
MKVKVKKKKLTKAQLLKIWNRDKHLYLLTLPALIFIIVFAYVPMYGVQLAFKDYVARDGITGSDWNNFAHFTRFFQSAQFWTLLKNTLSLSVYGLVAGFPFPIIFALLLNHTSNKKFKSTVQTVAYAPHFISMVVMCGMIILFLSPTTGVVNNMLTAVGLDSVYFMGKEELFYHIYVWTGVWQNVGWGTIIYVAALSAVSPELYEAAKMDGAHKLQLIRHIDLPTILPTIITLFILNMGSFMNVGFQKAYLLQNSMNLGASEIISTYVYKMGLLNGQFDYSTAISLFNNIINIILIVGTNTICKKLAKTALW